MNDRRKRPYSSTLRATQAEQTRDRILDALTDLLGEQPADAITTRAIAERAGVSQPTVYRHYPDRQALLEGLSDRLGDAIAERGGRPGLGSLDDLSATAVYAMALTDERAVEATAQAILNSDPRRLSRDSRARTAELRRVVASSLPDYDESDHERITALLRCIYSAQVWLRMREEFGLPGVESGALVEWAMATLVRELRAGSFPRLGPIGGNPAT